jgi:AcrR family transcriptional regulator
MCYSIHERLLTSRQAGSLDVIRSGVGDTRDELLNAAHELLRARGIMGATTREIARAAGVADGTLYNHFRTREDLFLALFDRILPAFKQARSELPLRVGQGDVRSNVEAVMVPMLEFFREVVPIFAAVFSDPALNERYRARMTAEDRGPHKASIPFEKYLQAEQRMGRMSDQVDAPATAQQLVAAAFFQAFTERFLAKKPTAAADRRWASAQIKAISTGWDIDARA